jgi:methylthioribose-1-phosphate isomerase
MPGETQRRRPLWLDADGQALGVIDQRQLPHQFVTMSLKTVDDVISELLMSRVTERGTRADDHRAEAAMEDRKRQGYF